MIALARRTGTPVILSHEEEEPIALLPLSAYEALLESEMASYKAPASTQSPQREPIEEVSPFLPEDMGDIERMSIDIPVLESISETETENPNESTKERAPQGEEKFYLEPID